MLEDSGSLQEEGVGGVAELHGSRCAEQVAQNEARELPLNQFVRGLNHQVTSLVAVLFGIVGKGFDQILLAEVLGHGNGGVKLRKARAVPTYQ